VRSQRIAERIGLPEDIRESLGQIYERWDGKGLPRGLSGNTPATFTSVSSGASIVLYGAFA